MADQEKENKSEAPEQAPTLPEAKPEKVEKTEDDVIVAKEPEYSQDFRATAFCPRCRRDYTMRSCITKADTLLTEMQVICPRCKKKLKRFRLKEWYAHYVQNEFPAPKVSDEPVSEDDHHH